MIKIYNTLSNKKEKFNPQKKKLYQCMCAA
jgi:cysteinyl-tRNA synthetase